MVSRVYSRQAGRVWKQWVVTFGVDTTKGLARDGPSWSDIAKDPQEIILRWWEDSMSIIVVLHISAEYLLIAMKPLIM